MGSLWPFDVGVRHVRSDPSGGKQHRVVEGETLRLEKFDVATGDSIDFEDVLMVGEGAKVKIGTPNVKGGKVTAEVLATEGRKGKGIKFRRRHSRTQQNHNSGIQDRLPALLLVGLKGDNVAHKKVVVVLVVGSR